MTHPSGGVEDYLGGNPTCGLHRPDRDAEQRHSLRMAQGLSLTKIRGPRFPKELCTRQTAGPGGR